MANRQRPPPAAPSRSAGYASLPRRAASGSPASSSIRGMTPTRTPLSVRRTGATTTPPSTGRRKPRPQWNEYLTDDAQYRLTQERQLVRHMQQLSAAHFHARSPARRREEVSRGEVTSMDASWESYTNDSSEVLAAPQESRASSEIQGEISRLEEMLSDLEHESEFLPEADASQENDDWEDECDQEEPREVGYDREESEGHDHPTEAEGDTVDEEQREGREETSDEGFDDPVAKICVKSLRIGMDLTHKMQQLARELDHERRHRKKHERRIIELEQQCQATETRCQAIEAQYDEVSSQLDGMRDAMIATEEAIHRLTQELLRSRQAAPAMQERSVRSSQPQRYPDSSSTFAKEADDPPTEKENRRVTFNYSDEHNGYAWTN